jgi:hypothetical protein
LSIYFSWAEHGIQVCFISKISVTWGPSVSHTVPVFALLLAERGGAARRRGRGYKPIPTGSRSDSTATPVSKADRRLASCATPTALVRCLARLAAMSERCVTACGLKPCATTAIPAGKRRPQTTSAHLSQCQLAVASSFLSGHRRSPCQSQAPPFLPRRSLELGLLE